MSAKCKDFTFFDSSFNTYSSPWLWKYIIFYKNSFYKNHQARIWKYFKNFFYLKTNFIQSWVGAVIIHLSPKLQVCPSGCHLTINYKTFLLLSVFSRCPTATTQGSSKWPGPLYRSKIKVSQSTPCGYSKLVSQDALKDGKD